MYPILKGIRILDITAVILGPFGAQILGDLGAEVIKIEPPEGDSMRPIAPLAVPGMSAIFANNNRNKKSVALDLKSAGGKAALSKLIPTCDVLIHNMRQEALDKLGFSYEVVRKLNPGIIYCAANGFGKDGPYAGRPAYDDVIQACSGIAGLFALRDGTAQYVPSIVADKVTGLHLAYAVMAALLHKERSGQAPGYVEIPMFETMTAFSLNEHLAGATFGDASTEGYVRVVSPDRKPYRTMDGFVGVLPYTQDKWTKVLGEIGLPHVAKEAWFLDPTERSKRVGELYAMLAEKMSARTTDEWCATFMRLDVPHARVNSPTDLLSDEHLAAIGFFKTNFAGETPVKRNLRAPITFSDVPREKDLPPPMLGADTRAVLAAAGLSEAEIAAALPRAEPKVASKG
jgi:crotonobetainyl-CoA:carnitine CoA-transferase CaiB-like acyl-CoA transferase